MGLSGGGFDVGQPVIQILNVDSCPDVHAFGEFAEFAFLANRKLHSHRLHPVADLFVLDQSGLPLRIESLDDAGKFVFAYLRSGRTGRGARSEDHEGDECQDRPARSLLNHFSIFAQ